MNLSTTRSGGWTCCLALASLLLSSGCVSQKTLQEYQDEVRLLREERTNLKKENRNLRMQLDSYEAALADANAQLTELPEARYDELDDLGIEYGSRNGQFFISIPSEITFASGKAELSRGGKEALRAVARRLLEDHPGGDYWIEGHTDSDPIKKSSWGSNRDLSVARGMAVLHFLVEECNVPDDSCVVAGHGQYNPLAANDSKEGKAKNRRVEIVVRPTGT